MSKFSLTTLFTKLSAAGQESIYMFESDKNSAGMCKYQHIFQ